MQCHVTDARHAHSTPIHLYTVTHARHAHSTPILMNTCSDATCTDMYYVTDA
jgi:hypothetical protein